MALAASGATAQPGQVDWSRFGREVPGWFLDAKLGIFVHWGAYSVPAWAEPTGELGTVDEKTWFVHNPYAEWYWNTVRLPGSPAREHHNLAYGGAPYDQFLDAWRAESFDPDSWAELFSRAGARYVVPTSKHHDGITLWDAPGSGTRNTVARGPRRDLIAAIADAVRREGMRFGVYYSGGLDWSVGNLAPIDTAAAVRQRRPVDPAYAAYCHLHVRDLIERFAPDVLWNDIEWPDAGKHSRSLGLAELFDTYYHHVPHGLVNDRFGETHWDFKTSEYQAHRESESASAWEHCRGLGLSFGYNSVEEQKHLLSARQLVRLFVDVVSRGGNLLLNVGPRADGAIPEMQRQLLEELGSWNATYGYPLFGSRPLGQGVAAPSEQPWIRWVRRGDELWGFVDVPGQVVLPVAHDRVDVTSARRADGGPLAVEPVAGGLRADLDSTALPQSISFRMRAS